MRTSPTYLALISAGALAIGCSDDGEDDDVVRTRSSATADFTEYRTYAVATAEDVDEERRPNIPDTVATNLEIVSDAMREELNALGLREVGEDEDPDLYAFNLAATREITTLSWECVDSYWYGYWTWTWDPCPWLEPVYDEDRQGAIVLGLLDPERQDVVFGGVIEGIGEGPVDQDELKERIEDDVDEVFEDYPEDQMGDD